MALGVHEHPFYKPLKVRIGIVVVTAFWAALELWNSDGFWSAIAAAVFVYCVWTFLIKFPSGEHQPGP